MQPLLRPTAVNASTARRPIEVNSSHSDRNSKAAVRRARRRRTVNGRQMKFAALRVARRACYRSRTSGCGQLRSVDLVVQIEAYRRKATKEKRKPVTTRVAKFTCLQIADAHVRRSALFFSKSSWR